MTIGELVLENAKIKSQNRGRYIERLLRFAYFNEATAIFLIFRNPSYIFHWDQDDTTPVAFFPDG